MRTDQELFTQIVTGLKAQGYQQSQIFGKCRYRGPDGLKCAVGHCIDDELYYPAIEGTSVLSLPLKVLPERERPILNACQRAHDGARSPADLEAELRDVATRYDLEFPDEN